MNVLQISIIVHLYWYIFEPTRLICTFYHILRIETLNINFSQILQSDPFTQLQKIFTDFNVSLSMHKI